jgi:starch phosphorylase
VQLVISGKAHPADQQGQDLIKEWMKFIRQEGVHPPVIFLADYDMQVSEKLVQGVDVWINTPRRPWEASGTSGMKVLANGGINLSVLDGWWAEAYSPEVGWALGNGDEHGDDPVWDTIEAEQLYNLLEQEVVPEFYNRNETGIPTAWIARMRESMAQLTPRFSADRTVREYTEQLYLPAAKNYLERVANNGELAKKIIVETHLLEQNWTSMHFGEVKSEMIELQYMFEVEVYFNELDPNTIKIALFANGINGEPPIVQVMTQGEKLEGTNNGYKYKAMVTATRSASDYTARAIPSIPGVVVPLEISKILWNH